MRKQSFEGYDEAQFDPFGPIEVDRSKELNRWYVFPENLPNRHFRGCENREDESQIRGAFPVGQNVSFGGASLPSLRDGYAVIGTETTDSTPVKRAWVHERRDGVQIELKAYSTGLYAWIIGVSSAFALLKGGFTSGQEFAFANIGQSSDTFSLLNFCNGTENPFKWSGAYALYSSNNGVNQITVQGTTTLANLGFSATGTLIINEVEITYTGLNNQTFTGCSAVPVGAVSGDIIFQTPIELTGVVGGGTDPAKYSVATAHDGRLHVRRESKKSVWDYSKLDNPDDFATGSSDGDGGAKEVEFGGPITSFGKLNKTALALKKRIIKILDFIQVGSRLDSPRYQTLVSADDKGTTLGAMNQKSTVSTPLGLVFITPDKRLVLLTGITANAEPQYQFLSDPIQPIFDQGVFDDASIICSNNILWIAFKTDIASTYNDVVLRADLTRQSIDNNGRVLPVRWDLPFVGWNVSDWTVIYNATTGKNELHFHSSLNSNSYKVVDSKTDNTTAFTATVRTWSEHFDFPQHQKRINEAYIEVRMKENTELLCTLLYDENGVTSQKELTLSGDSADFRFDSTVYNPVGASAFGSVKIGSNPDVTNLPTYRFNLEINPNIYFFNIALQLSTDGEAQDFQLVRFAYCLSEIVRDTDRKYLKA